jgi:hypothetical protein
MFGKAGDDLTFVGALLVFSALFVACCGPGFVLGWDMYKGPGPTPKPGSVVVSLAYMASVAVAIAYFVLGRKLLRRIGLRFEKDTLQAPSKYGWVIPVVLLGVLVIGIVVAIVVAVRMSGNSLKENYAKIQVGMSRDEVMEILGPTREFSLVFPEVPGTPSRRTIEWTDRFWSKSHTPTWRITVVFEDDKVVKKEKEGF